MSPTLTLFTAGLAVFGPVVSAVYTAKGDTPSGNAIYEPGLNSVVPAGKPFTITWDPTTKGKVSLTLCHGPSTNCVTVKTIADSIDNSGNYDWTPTSDLEPSQPTGYGIQLVAEDGTYQYTTQFGISNDQYSSGGSSSASSASASTAETSSAPESASSAHVVTSTPAAKVAAAVTDISESASSVVASATSAASSVASAGASAVTSAASEASATGSNGTTATSSSLVFKGTSGAAAFTGWGFANSTDVKPSGSAASMASSLRTSTKTGSSSSSTGSSSASSSGSAAAASSTQTGAAAQLGASFGALAFVAGLVVMVL
ncbi:hypothetical protein AAFC00_006129 [Neodothiora populina]|uniref:Yeast cell wall synthesis Kre9/Knh1-like N-terminal domain-containing protein n=1 Tax=Neodothiora populina TaxID=2781224 RepID=A0ABR3P4Y2_9PEZI